MVAASALLYLLVATEADQHIAAARRTDRAVADIDKAHSAAQDADAGLLDAFNRDLVPLIGAGREFDNDTAGVNTDVTSATEGNAAGKRGRTQILFVQSQLITCQKMARDAVRDYPSDGKAAVAAAHDELTHQREKDPQTHRPIPDTGGLVASLEDLKNLEQEALDHQRHSRWLDPAFFWTLLIGPVIAMLLLAVATGYVVARHFRRHVSPRLGAALLITAAVGVTAGVLAGYDGRHLSSDPSAGHPVTMTLCLALLATAGVLAHLAYRPRLAEYRFPRS
jgi:hypothetical protein